MQFWEGVRLAMVQIRTEKLKSFFSLLGVIIGVLFLIVVVSVVEGMDRYIRESVASELFGVNTMTLRRTPEVQINPSEEERRNWARRQPITFDDADAIRQKLSIPSRVLVEIRTGRPLVGDNGRTATGVQVLGASADVFVVRNLVVEKGRPFSLQEADRGASVIVLGKSTAEVIFRTSDPLGRLVRIQGDPYRVVGVLEERGSMLGENLDNLAIAPARSPLQTLTSRRGVVSQVVIQAVDPDLLLDAKAEVEGIMRVRRQLRPAEGNDFSIETVDETLSFWDRISTILFLALPGLVAISLVVGGIVIMNIMLVSVMERTREIGVRKALGARRRDILTQVIVESATLSTLGAALGVAAGGGLAMLVRAVSPLPAAVDPKWVTLGVALGMTVGIVAGVYPAARASKMDPVVALRYE
jgi:putative ABC transport system permease protein